MNPLRFITRSLRAVFRRRKTETEMAEEIRLHLELQTEQNLAAGMDPDEARYAALRKFGGVEQIKERCRDQRGWVWLELRWKELRFIVRSLRRAPGFTAAVVATLALCIGANTTVLSVLYGLILKPLPFRDAGQLVEIYNSQPNAGQPKMMTSVAQYLDFKANADLFEDFALWRAWSFNIGEESDPERGIGIRATADIFAMLGIQPLLGRFYTMEECAPGRDHVLVLTQSFWEKNYAADPTVIGRTIRLSSEPFRIIGVAPRSLEAFNVDLVMLKPFEWLPQLSAPQARGVFNATMYARVKSGLGLQSALAQLATLEKHFRDDVAPPGLRDFYDRNGQQVALGRVRAEQTKTVKTSLLLLQGGALFVLLLGCVNVASLMLARANARQAELAVRQALGASRGALARQMFAEGMILAMSGAVLGLTLTWASLRVINRYTIAMVREVQPVTLDLTVLGATIFGAMVVALLIGLLPIVKTWRTNLLTSMQGGSRGASGGGGMRAASGLLVTTQVALALTLLVGACLLIRSFAKVMAIDPGFDAKRVVHGRVAYNGSYVNEASILAVQEQIMRKMREIPGVESAAYSSHLPVNMAFHISTFPIRGSVLGKEDTYPTGAWMGVSPEFFETMGIRILEGRAFNEADYRPNARRVFIVDRRFAERYFPGRSPVGEMFGFAAPGQKPEECPVFVGVAEIAKLYGQEDRGGVPFVYSAMGAGGGGISIVVKTARPYAEVASAMRAQLRSVDSTLPLYQMATLQMQLDALAGNRRGVMLLLGAFAGIALMLSAVGMYGMLAYDVTQRTREIGIRGAIGATRGQVVRMILRQGLVKAGLGLVIGLAASFYLSRFMSSQLYDVKASDPLVYAVVTGLLLAVALLASWLPARRAAKVDPMVALRCE
jgi:predicted permease